MSLQARVNAAWQLDDPPIYMDAFLPTASSFPDTKASITILAGLLTSSNNARINMIAQIMTYCASVVLLHSTMSTVADISVQLFTKL